LKNLENNIKNGKPNDAFLWPEIIAGPFMGSYGYLMALRPPEYRNFTDILLAKVRFGSIAAMLSAAMQISEGFEILHRKGYSYQDLNDGNFFIRPDTGQVLICDNDNVSEFGQKSGIAGKSRYMAPEVVTGKTSPDKWTDMFSLSVILFLLFFNNHPLEGKWALSIPCMDEALERKLYGESPVFIWDAKNDSNRPVRGIHNNVIKRWPFFPEILKDTFARAFSKDAMTVQSERQTRVMEIEWKKVFIAMRNTLLTCPYCRKETFLKLSGESACVECGKTIRKPKILAVGKEQIALMGGMKLYASTTRDSGSHHEVTGEVYTDRKNSDMSGIRNLSKDAWIAFTRSGEQRSIAPGQAIPVLEGIKITFQGGKRAEII
jgi:serine/threonine protein kinase